MKALWAVRLFMLPHTVAGPAIIIAALFSASVLLFGSTVSGTVFDKKIITDSESATTYEIKYDFTFNNQLHHASGRTNQSTYERLKPGDHVSAKILPQTPDFGTQLLDGNAPWKVVLFMFCFGGGWTALMLIIFQHVYLAPNRRTSVMKSGKMCVGKITDKSITGEDHNVYNLAYQYEPSPGQYVTGMTNVTKTQFDIARVNEDVTVLYSLEFPGYSLIYRYSDYRLIVSQQTKT